MLKSQDEILKLTSSLEKAVDRNVRKFCQNLKCNAKTVNLTDASTLARVCFGVPNDGRPWKICDKCRLKAFKFEKESKHAIKSNGNLFSAVKFDMPMTDQDGSIVDLESTDTAPVKNEISKKLITSSDAPDAEYEVCESDLTNTVNSIIQRLAVCGHVRKCKETLSEEVDVLAVGFDVAERQLEEIGKSIMDLTKKYQQISYSRVQNIELGTVDIDIDGNVVVEESDQLDEKVKTFKLEQQKSVTDFKKFATAAMQESNRKKQDDPIIMAQDVEIPVAFDQRRRNCENVPPISPSLNFRPNRKLLFKLPAVNQMVYAMYDDVLNFWVPAKVISVKSFGLQNTVIDVKYHNIESHRNSVQGSSKNLPSVRTKLFGGQIAFSKPIPTSVLPVGTRVIAKFNDLLGGNHDKNGMYYVGFIAEIYQPSNKQRYLIFFDNGYPQYTSPDEVLPVVEPGKVVWEDIHANVRNFAKNYLTHYPNQCVLNPTVGCRYKIEYDGKWLQALVVDVDCSLMKVQYPDNIQMNFEWIYVGSPRIRQVYNATQNSFTPDQKTVVERVNVEMKSCVVAGTNEVIEKSPVVASQAEERISLMNIESAGATHKIEIPITCPSPKEFVPHKCSPSCVQPYVEDDFRKISPLVIPFHLGWAREFRGAKLGAVAYITPCGLRLDSYETIHSYNRITDNDLPIEFFSLEPMIDCLNEFKSEHLLMSLKDISYGKEWTPVQCVNSVNQEMPVCVDYWNRRRLGQGVNINFDDNFMVCCDCVDDCKDKSKCACWQLTLSGISFKKKANLQGYAYRRLKDWVESGIYECNHKCKCKVNTCLNRVVQSKVKWPVQVFRTILKGWGVRALHDIPKGSFLCLYTGKLLNDTGANQEGLLNGDEYLADLDFVEVMESIKEGYESDCSDIQEEEKTVVDLLGIPETGRQQVARKSTGGRKVMGEKRSTKSNETHRPIFNKNPSQAIRYRAYFGPHEQPYSVDGKGFGNFGRYFNHSCDPNLFIQNIFVDTHDLRFPWVAFFTKKDVKAGTELCWDYKYQVGSVPGKHLYCYCGSRNCRGRLL